MTVLFLALAAAFTFLAVVAWLPLARRRAGAPWLLALVIGETAPQRILGAVTVAAVFWAFGWIVGWPGRAALGLVTVGVALLAVVHVRALRARRILERAASEAAGRPLRLGSLPLRDLLRPTAPPRGTVAITRGLAYGTHPKQRVDRHRAAGCPGSAPALLYVHGGGWTGGRRGRQAKPVIRHLAESGWVVLEVGYRLSPEATFPEHLIDVKRAIAWVRETAGEHGVDPSFLGIAGGSAGGHLAALAALTQNDPTLQPGFEEADTSLQACVPIYGVHDLLDRTGTRPLWPYLARHVLKAPVAGNTEMWHRASPARIASADRPPFLVLHGGSDSLVRPGQSRRLVAALRAAGGAPVGHAELPGATHGFDSVASVRGIRTAQAIEAMLTAVREGSHSRG